MKGIALLLLCLPGFVAIRAQDSTTAAVSLIRSNPAVRHDRSASLSSSLTPVLSSDTAKRLSPGEEDEDEENKTGASGRTKFGKGTAEYIREHRHQIGRAHV